MGSYVSASSSFPVCVYESLPCVDYIDEVFPHKPLLPTSPVERAKIWMEIKFFGEMVIRKFYALLMSITMEKIGFFH